MAKKPAQRRGATAPAYSEPTISPPRFVAPVPDHTVPLIHPVEYAGRTYVSITRRRPSSGVLGRWFEQFTEGAAVPGDPNLNVPIFVDEAGDLVPDAVLGFLDDDDRQTVFEDADRFFPKRLAVALEALTEESPPSSGEPAEPTSSA
ncbi:MAG: hypothetical protein Q7T93_04320 [Methylobacterium sp.]|uniref:hypothetical protein n=1 Tax=Methylobacterium sp. TaxID=409 RepID=UPI00271B5620|nr:hypothetical protein [Methylobacterium sp.]MDO9426035.1 hypothetical protein [Methylobacterium sp.]